jgi:MHS family citrate/tricarballylate:H+ symporter-like MFS transporter
VRTAAFSLAFSLATAIFGGFTPAVSTYLIEMTGNRAAPALWLSLAAVISLSAALMCRPLAEGESLSLVEEPGVVRRAPVHA